MAFPSFNDVVLRYQQVALRQRLGAAVAILGSFLALDYMWVYQDQQSGLDAAISALQATEAQRAEKTAYAASSGLYEARLNELTTRLADARAMLPDHSEVPQFLSQTGAIAKEVGLLIERFEPQPEIPNDFYAESRFALQVRGTFHEIGLFLDRVGRMDRIVNISDLIMEAPKVHNGRVLVTGTFLLRAFRSMSAAEVEALKAQAHKEGAQ